MKRAKFTIRTGKDADWTALGQAVANIQDFEHEIIGYPLRPGCDVWDAYLSDLRHRLTADKAIFLVAEANQEIVGVLAGYAHEAGDCLVASDFDRSAYISDLFVQSEWRRQGVGTALIGEFERSMRARGLHWMTVCVKSKNKTARQAYQRYGFEDYEVTLTKRLF